MARFIDRALGRDLVDPNAEWSFLATNHERLGKRRQLWPELLMGSHGFRRISSPRPASFLLHGPFRAAPSFLLALNNDLSPETPCLDLRESIGVWNR